MHEKILSVRKIWSCTPSTFLPAPPLKQCMKDNNYYERNELIPNVRKFAKKLQITIHSIGAVKIEKQAAF